MNTNQWLVVLNIVGYGIGFCLLFWIAAKRNDIVSAILTIPAMMMLIFYLWRAQQ